MPFLSHAPTSGQNNVGEAPKSESLIRWDAGTVNAATGRSVRPFSSTIDVPAFDRRRPASAFPVEMNTNFLPTAALDHTDPPRAPRGTDEYFANSRPVACMTPTTPPRTSGRS